MRHHRIARERPVMLLLALPVLGARAQAPATIAFPPLPATGVTCTASPATNDLKRLGVWQMLQIQGAQRVLVVALDASQRPRVLWDWGGISSPVQQRVMFDSTGSLLEPPFSRSDSSRRNLTAAERDRARKLAADVIHHCSPLPRIVGLGQPIPPAEHTTVLQEIPADRQRTCRSMALDASSASHGIAKRLMLSTTQPQRYFTLDVDSAGQPRVLSAMVMWGAQQRSERETASITFDARGGAQGTKMLGYAGPDGNGATFVLTSAEITSARLLADEVLKRCAH